MCKNTIDSTLHFSYYKVYDQITNLTINTVSSFEIIDLGVISDISINIPFKFKVIRKSEVTKEMIEESTFPILNQKIISAIDNQKHMFIEEKTDFILSSNALPVDNYTIINVKDITFTIMAVSTSKKLKNSLHISIAVEPFVETIDLDKLDDNLQSVEVKLNYETYNHIKTRISPIIYQTIDKVDNTAIEGKDYEVQFKNQHQQKINLKDIVKQQQVIIVVIKAIKGKDKPFINEKDIKLEIDDKWL